MEASPSSLPGTWPKLHASMHGYGLLVETAPSQGPDPGPGPWTHCMYTTDRSTVTTPAGKRFLSNAVAFKVIQRLAQLKVPAAYIEAVEDIIADALNGRFFDDEHEHSDFAHQAIMSRNAIEKYLVRYHADMVKLGAPVEICRQELLYQLTVLESVGLSTTEAMSAVKH